MNSKMILIAGAVILSACSGESNNKKYGNHVSGLDSNFLVDNECVPSDSSLSVSNTTINYRMNNGNQNVIRNYFSENPNLSYENAYQEVFINYNYHKNETHYSSGSFSYSNEYAFLREFNGNKFISDKDAGYYDFNSKINNRYNASLIKVNDQFNQLYALSIQASDEAQVTIYSDLTSYEILAASKVVFDESDKSKIIKFCPTYSCNIKSKLEASYNVNDQTVDLIFSDNVSWANNFEIGYFDITGMNDFDISLLQLFEDPTITFSIKEDGQILDLQGDYDNPHYLEYKWNGFTTGHKYAISVRPKFENQTSVGYCSWSDYSTVQIPGVLCNGTCK